MSSALGPYEFRNAKCILFYFIKKKRDILTLFFKQMINALITKLNTLMYTSFYFKIQDFCLNLTHHFTRVQVKYF